MSHLTLITVRNPCNLPYYFTHFYATPPISGCHLWMVPQRCSQQCRQFRYASIVNSLSLLLAHWPRRHAPPAVSPPTISKTGHLQIEEDHQNDGCMVIVSLPINHPGKCSAQTFPPGLIRWSDAMQAPFGHVRIRARRR